MAWLSFVEAGKAFGISRKVLMRWEAKGLIPSRTEFRGKRQVTVVDEESLRAHLQTTGVPTGELIDESDVGPGQTSVLEQDSGTAAGQHSVPPGQDPLGGQEPVTSVGSFLVALQMEKTQLQTQVSTLSQELGRLQGILAERDNTLGQLLEAKDNILSERDKRIDDKDRQLADQGRQLDELREWYRQSAATKEKPRWRWPWSR